MESSGILHTIDQLDPMKNMLNQDNLPQFLSEFDHTYMDRTKPKGPDYIVIDNLFEIFEDLNKDVLLAARKDAEQTTNELCDLMS